MRTRVGMRRRPAKNPGAAHRIDERDGPSSFPIRIWRAFDSPCASAEPTKRVGSVVAQPRVHCPPIRTAVVAVIPTPSRESHECKASAAKAKSVREAVIREAMTREAAADAVTTEAAKAAAMKAAAA